MQGLHEILRKKMFVSTFSLSFKELSFRALIRTIRSKTGRMVSEKEERSDVGQSFLMEGGTWIRTCSKTGQQDRSRWFRAGKTPYGDNTNFLSNFVPRSSRNAYKSNASIHQVQPKTSHITLTGSTELIHVGHMKTQTRLGREIDISSAKKSSPNVSLQIIESCKTQEIVSHSKDIRTTSAFVSASIPNW